MNAARLRGQPLAALVGVIAVYAAARTALWQPLFEMLPDGLPESIGLAAQSAALPEVAFAKDHVTDHAPPIADMGREFADARRSRPLLAKRRWWARPAPASFLGRELGAVHLAPTAPSYFVPGREAAPQASTFEAQKPARPVTPSAPSVGTSRNRLSLDAWVFARQDGSRPSVTGPLAPGPQSAALGLSQAGVVVRYHLGDRGGRDPLLYARATSALTVREADLALGAAIRPLPALPLRLHAEARVSRNSGGTELRPAAFATFGVDGRPLPFGLEARGYAQAGYVGGDDATGFADGFAVAERAVVRTEGSAIRLGAGVWGGAQRGVERLDVGPSASIAFELGGAPVRVSADYRFRVAGDARPGSGAAVTLSTGF